MFTCKHSEESKRKISESMKGKKKTEEHKENIGKSVHETSEREKIIAANIAAGKPWNTGLKWNAEVRAKIVAAHQARKPFIEERRRKEEEKKRQLREEQRLQRKIEKQLEKERLLQEAQEQITKDLYSPLTSEEWVLPMETIALNRGITVKEVNEIFFKQIRYKNY